MSINETPDIDRMNHREFEYFIADLWRRQGYEAHPTQASGDGGVDIVAENESERIAIEAKWRSDGKLGPGHARKIAGVAQRPEFDRGVLVTNKSFTDSAYRESNDMNVTLVDGEQVRELDRQTRRQPAMDNRGEADDVGALWMAVGTFVAVATYFFEDPERLVRIFQILVILFVIYIVADAFAGVIGIDLPGGV